MSTGNFPLPLGSPMSTPSSNQGNASQGISSPGAALGTGTGTGSGSTSVRPAPIVAEPRVFRVEDGVA